MLPPNAATSLQSINVHLPQQYRQMLGSGLLPRTGAGANFGMAVKGDKFEQWIKDMALVAERYKKMRSEPPHTFDDLVGAVDDLAGDAARIGLPARRDILAEIRSQYAASIQSPLTSPQHGRGPHRLALARASKRGINPWPDIIKDQIETLREDPEEWRALAKQCRAWKQERKERQERRGCSIGSAGWDGRAYSPARVASRRAARAVLHRGRCEQVKRAAAAAALQARERMEQARLARMGSQHRPRETVWWHIVYIALYGSRMLDSVAQRRALHPEHVLQVETGFFCSSGAMSPNNVASPASSWLSPRRFRGTSFNRRLTGCSPSERAWMQVEARQRWAMSIIGYRGFRLRMTIGMRIYRKRKVIAIVRRCLLFSVGAGLIVKNVREYKRKVTRAQRAFREYRLLKRARLDLWISDWLRAEDGLRRELLAGRNIAGIQEEEEEEDESSRERPVWLPVGLATASASPRAAGKKRRHGPVPHDPTFRRSPRKKLELNIADRVVVLPPCPAHLRDSVLSAELVLQLRSWGNQRAAYSEKMRYYEHQCTRWRIACEQAAQVGCSAEELVVGVKEPVLPKKPFWRILLPRQKLRDLVVTAAKVVRSHSEDRVRSQLNVPPERRPSGAVSPIAALSPVGFKRTVVQHLSTAPDTASEGMSPPMPPQPAPPPAATPLQSAAAPHPPPAAVPLLAPRAAAAPKPAPPAGAQPQLQASPSAQLPQRAPSRTAHPTVTVQVEPEHPNPPYWSLREVEPTPAGLPVTPSAPPSDRSSTASTSRPPQQPRRPLPRAACASARPRRSQWLRPVKLPTPSTSRTTTVPPAAEIPPVIPRPPDWVPPGRNAAVSAPRPSPYPCPAAATKTEKKEEWAGPPGCARRLWPRTGSASFRRPQSSGPVQRPTCLRPVAPVSPASATLFGLASMGTLTGSKLQPSSPSHSAAGDSIPAIAVMEPAS
eukprot:TRINITY_DN23674_c0_g1_i1.p1 TRINITY_DN23674_c0_g1~~TRINITY_DN23674_c0_g1_i1.p1  ORF type:complete len:946 (+),score=143.34 TRINITY_DN23674_c0_g1_i1:793-3630(+)